MISYSYSYSIAYCCFCLLLFSALSTFEGMIGGCARTFNYVKIHFNLSHYTVDLLLLCMPLARGAKIDLDLELESLRRGRPNFCLRAPMNSPQVTNHEERRLSKTKSIFLTSKREITAKSKRKKTRSSKHCAPLLHTI